MLTEITASENAAKNTHLYASDASMYETRKFREVVDNNTNHDMKVATCWYTARP